MSRTVEDCKNDLSYIVATRRYCSERGEENLASVIGLLISDLIARKDPPYRPVTQLLSLVAAGKAVWDYSKSELSNTGDALSIYNADTELRRSSKCLRTSHQYIDRQPLDRYKQ